MQASLVQLQYSHLRDNNILPRPQYTTGNTGMVTKITIQLLLAFAIICMFFKTAQGDIDCLVEKEEIKKKCLVTIRKKGDYYVPQRLPCALWYTQLYMVKRR